LTFFKLHAFAASGKPDAPRELSHDWAGAPQVASRDSQLY
jgi:hypothetical protein